MTEEADTRAAKWALRERMRALRGSLSDEENGAASEAIWLRIHGLALWKDVRTVHTFIGALPGEVRTETLIAWCLAHGRTVIVPVVERGSRQLHHVLLESIGKLRRTSWGGLQPEEGCAADPGSADLVIVPGLAFDRAGRRLGMGRGFYDQFLAEVTVTKIAVAHSFQIVEAVPVHEHDVSVSLIVTPNEVIVPVG